MEYSPYGDGFTNTGPTDITHRFTGHDWDSVTGMYFAPHRFLDSNSHRWINKDGLGMIDGTNMYSYVKHNPIIGIDPLGDQLEYYPPPGGDVLGEIACKAIAFAQLALYDLWYSAQAAGILLDEKLMQAGCLVASSVFHLFGGPEFTTVGDCWAYYAYYFDESMAQQVEVATDRLYSIWDGYEKCINNGGPSCQLNLDIPTL